MRFLITLAALLMTSQASAGVICAGCEYDEGAEGSYLGAFDPLNLDRATFQHSGTGDLPFVDFWVFDVGPGAGVGSVSADFTVFAPLQAFAGFLFTDGGSVCPAFACTSVATGSLLKSAFDAGSRRWEILTGLLQPGRYVMQIIGGALPPRAGAYTGQIGFSIREPGTLALLGAGLLLMFGILRMRRH